MAAYFRNDGWKEDAVLKEEIAKLFKELYLSWVHKSTFFQGVGPGFWVKHDHILKSAFFTPLCPWGSWCVVKLLWESFLSENNALAKNVLFNLNPDFIFYGLFFCPWSLGRPKKCLGDVFGHADSIGSYFFQGVGPWFWVKKDQNFFNSTFVTPLCP